MRTALGAHLPLASASVARHARDEPRCRTGSVANTPGRILGLRAKVRLHKTPVDQRTEWLQRIHAVLFHHGAAAQPGASRDWTPASSSPSSSQMSMWMRLAAARGTKPSSQCPSEERAQPLLVSRVGKR